MQVVPLTKIHRLIRPLRSSLAALLLQTSLAQTRENDIALQRPQAKKEKGKGKAKVRDQDEDYGSKAGGKRPKHAIERVRREKQRDAGSPIASGSSSPFHAAQSQRTRYKKTAKYGTKRAGSQLSGLGARAPSTTSTSTRTSLPALDLRSRLLDSQMDPEVVMKVLHVIKAYRNILEGVYGTEGEALNEGGFDESTAFRVPSLVEISAREIGQGIEEAVKDYLRELEEENDLNPQKVDLEEDATKLLDEWYEDTPPHCRGWVLAEHATSLVIDGLEDSSYSILEGFFETCLSIGAFTEASRFFGPLATLGLHHPTAVPTKAIHLLTQSSFTRQTQSCLSSISSVLLSSSFASRLFYSSFLSLERVDLAEDKSGDLVSSLLEMEIAIASEMMQVITEASKEEQVKGGESFALEVVLRLDKEITCALSTLLRTFIKSNNPHPLRLFATSVFSFVSEFPQQSFDILAPTSAICELALVLLSVTNGDHPSWTSPPSLTSFPNSSLSLSRLSHLSALSPCPSPSPSQLPELLSLLPLLNAYLTTSSLLTLSALLNSALLLELESHLLGYAVEIYDGLADVKMTRGHPVLERDVFIERLRVANEQGVEEKGTGNVKRKFDAESAGVVAEATSESESGSEGDDQLGIKESPFAHSSLGRPFGDGQSSLLGRRNLPLKTPTRRGGRARTKQRKWKGGGGGASWSDEKVRRGLLMLVDSGKESEEDDDDDDEEEESPRARAGGEDIDFQAMRRVPIIDLSLDSDSVSNPEPQTSNLVGFPLPSLDVSATSEPDDLDLLSRSRGPVNKRRQKRRKVSFASNGRIDVAKKGVVESSDDELAI